MSYEVYGIEVEELELEEIELTSYDEALREGFALLEEALPPSVDTGVLEDFGL